MDVSSLYLNKHEFDDIFYPENNYFTSNPLPEQWIEAFQNKENLHKSMVLSFRSSEKDISYETTLSLNKYISPKQKHARPQSSNVNEDLKRKSSAIEELNSPKPGKRSQFAIHTRAFSTHGRRPSQFKGNTVPINEMPCNIKKDKEKDKIKQVVLAAWKEQENAMPDVKPKKINREKLNEDYLRRKTSPYGDVQEAYKQLKVKRKNKRQLHRRSVPTIEINEP